MRSLIELFVMFVLVSWVASVVNAKENFIVLAVLIFLILFGIPIFSKLLVPPRSDENSDKIDEDK